MNDEAAKLQTHVPQWRFMVRAPACKDCENTSRQQEAKDRLAEILSNERDGIGSKWSRCTVALRSIVVSASRDPLVCRAAVCHQVVPAGTEVSDVFLLATTHTEPATIYSKAECRGRTAVQGTTVGLMFTLLVTAYIALWHLVLAGLSVLDTSPSGGD